MFVDSTATPVSVFCRSYGPEAILVRQNRSTFNDPAFDSPLQRLLVATPILITSLGFITYFEKHTLVGYDIVIFCTVTARLLQIRVSPIVVSIVLCLQLFSWANIW